MTTTPQDNHGFTLIEVLVAIFVLAFGAIAVASMQLTAMRAAQESSLESVAIQLAGELADIMRSLPDASNAFLFTFPPAHGETPPEQFQLCYRGSNCTPQQMAAFTIREWQDKLAQSLPHARATVCRDSVPWDKEAAQFRWQCERNDKADIVIKIGWSGRSDHAGNHAPKLALLVPVATGAAP